MTSIEVLNRNYVITNLCQVPQTTNFVEINTLRHLSKYYTKTKLCQVLRTTNFVEINIP